MVGPVTEPMPPLMGKLSVAQPPECLCETWAAAKPLHPSLPLVLRCQREDWCRETSFQPLLPGDGGIGAGCASCSESLPSSCEGARKAAGGRGCSVLCALHKPNPSRLPQHTQAGLGGPERGASSCKHAWAGGSCPILTRSLPFALGIPCVLLSLISTSLAPGLSPLRGF